MAGAGAKSNQLLRRL